MPVSSASLPLLEGWIFGFDTVPLLSSLRREMKVNRLGSESRRRQTRSFRMSWPLFSRALADDSSVGSPSGIRRLPSQSISPRFHAASFF